MKTEFRCILCDTLLVILEKEIITAEDKSPFLDGSICDCGGVCQAVDIEE